MKVAKRFRWEAAHRLPWHGGNCRHLHGHSYAMTVEMEGTPDARGMLVDFYEVKKVLRPLIEAWDHATLVAEDDAALLAALDALGSKRYVLPFDSTSENVAAYAAAFLTREAGVLLHEAGVERVTVRVAETETCYAEHTERVSAPVVA